MITLPYVAAHQAYAAAGNRHDLWAFDVRVLVALHERGDLACARDLGGDLLCHESAVRRSVRMLSHRGLVESSMRPGISASLRLSDAGRGVVVCFLGERDRYLGLRVAA